MFSVNSSLSGAYNDVISLYVERQREGSRLKDVWRPTRYRATPSGEFMVWRVVDQKPSRPVYSEALKDAKVWAVQLGIPYEAGIICDRPLSESTMEPIDIGKLK